MWVWAFPPTLGRCGEIPTPIRVWGRPPGPTPHTAPRGEFFSSFWGGQVFANTQAKVRRKASARHWFASCSPTCASLRGPVEAHETTLSSEQESLDLERPTHVAAGELGPGDSTIPAHQGEPTAASGDEPDSPDEADGSAGTSIPAVRSGRLPKYVLEAIALMVVNGASYEDISASTGIPADRLRGLVAQGPETGFGRMVEAHRRKILRATAFHQMRLMDLLDHAYNAVSRALQDVDDPKLAKDTAFELFDRVVPQPQQADLEVNVGFQNVHLQSSVHQVFTKLGNNFESLLGALTTQDPDRHLKSDSVGYKLPDHATPDQVETLDVQPEPDTPAQ